MPNPEFKFKDARYSDPKNFAEYLEQHYLADRKLAYSKENIGVFIGLVRYLKQMQPGFSEWVKANPDKINQEDALAIQEIVRLEAQKINIMLAQSPRDLSTTIPKGFSDEAVLHLLSKIEDAEDIAVWHEVYSAADAKQDDAQTLPKPLTITDSTQSAPVVAAGVNTPHHMFSPTRASTGDGTPTAAAASPTANAGTPHTLSSPKDAETVLSSPVARELEAEMNQAIGARPGMHLVS